MVSGELFAALGAVFYEDSTFVWELLADDFPTDPYEKAKLNADDPKVSNTLCDGYTWHVKASEVEASAERETEGSEKCKYHENLCLKKVAEALNWGPIRATFIVTLPLLNQVNDCDDS